MKNSLLVIGAGGHARSVLDIALQNKDYESIACIDSSYPEVLHVDGLEEIPIIGTDADMKSLHNQGYRYFFVGIGDNKLRHKLFYKFLAMGFEPVNIISQHAIISPRAKLGKGICVMAGAVINVNTIIEDNCIINTNSTIDHDCYIEKSCHITPGVTMSGTVRVGEGTWVGVGASVIDNVTIGEWSYIGAGSAVVKNLESHTMFYGVPARKIKLLS